MTTSFAKEFVQKKNGAAINSAVINIGCFFIALLQLFFYHEEHEGLEEKKLNLRALRDLRGLTISAVISIFTDYFSVKYVQ